MINMHVNVEIWVWKDYSIIDHMEGWVAAVVVQIMYIISYLFNWLSDKWQGLWKSNPYPLTFFNWIALS